MSSEMIEEILKARYYLPGETSWEDICTRVSNFIGYNDEQRKEYFEMMKSKDFIPNSPCLFNAGTNSPLMSACFALGIDDSMESIYDALYKSAILFKMGAGVGFNFSRIRPEGAPVGSTQGVASGVLSFIRVFNESIDVIKQAGRRRGAAIAILNCDHPEIEAFIKSKTIDGKLTNFNISVLITDDFIKAIENDLPWDLKFNGKTYKTLPARDLFKLMYESTWKYGDPGYLYEGNVNKDNPNLHLGRITTTNPCVTGDTTIITKDGIKFIKDCINKEIEIWNGYEWSFATPRITNHNQKIYRVNFNTGDFIKCTEYHDFLINVDGQKTRVPLKNLRVGDHIVEYYVPIYTSKSPHVYDSGSTYKASDIIVDDITEQEEKEETVYCLHEPLRNSFVANGIITGNCGEIPILTDPKTGGGESCNLGSIDVSKFLKDGDINYTKLERTIRKATRFLNTIIYKNNYPFAEIEQMTKNTAKIGLGIMGWADLLIMKNMAYDSEDARKLATNLMKYINEIAINESVKISSESGPYPAWHGSTWEKKGVSIANSVLTCEAPTGSISILADCSNGIEPVTAFVHERKNCVGKKFFVVHKLFDESLKKECKKANENYDAIIQHCYKTGTIQDIPWISDEFKRIFKSSLDIGWREHLLMQEAFQKSVGNSISKTINAPRDIPIDDVKDAIILAWKLGCKGFTLYRLGSKENEVISLANSEESDILNEDDGAMEDYPKERPDVLFGATYVSQSGCGKLYTTINYLEGKPYEVFVFSGGSGGCQAQNEGIGRLASLALRNQIDYKKVIKQLKKVKCPVAMKNQKANGKSCADIIGDIISKSMGDEIESGKEKQTSLSPRARHPINKQPTKVVSATLCPDCGEPLEFGEGCNKGACPNCGWSGCA